MRVDVLLDLVHELIVMGSFADVGQLALAVAVDQQHCGGKVGVVVAGEPLDQRSLTPSERPDLRVVLAAWPGC
jgi:hypothetical protein